jgi:tRNA pseudouridine38-40 synthase
LRYFFHIGYHGQAYHGWQKNDTIESVQMVIENKIAQVLKKKVFIIGCGRTDAQVNASQYYFHADFEEPLAPDFLFKFNKALPADISVFDILLVDSAAHARFDAIQRQYDYFIHNYKDPFLSQHSAMYLGLALDTTLLKQATNLLKNYSDYKCFCTSPDKKDNTLCIISDAKWYITPDQSRYRFQISANRFLTKMIRIIVGQLMRVGTKKLSVSEFESYLINQQTPAILYPAHPQGLYLSKITYPYLNQNPKTSFLDLNFEEEKWELV